MKYNKHIHTLSVNNIYNPLSFYHSTRMSRNTPTCPAEHLLVQVLHRVDRTAPEGQGQSLHVPALGTAEGEDTLLGEHVQGQGVNTYIR